jgi:heme exporter protein A
VIPEAPIVELRGVAGRVGSTTILRDVDFSLARGEAVGLFGANGAGKTTLLRIIATLMRPAAGSGSVLGADLRGPDRLLVRPRIGLISHLPGLYPELTLAENLHFAARISGLPFDRVGDALAAVGLANAKDRRADACSHGMQRRAEFGREMMRQPALLLLDEPHTALDPAAVELVGHLVELTTASGGGVVVVSHDAARVASLVDRTTHLAAGSLR